MIKNIYNASKEGNLTVGKLKELIQDMPDDAEVFTIGMGSNVYRGCTMDSSKEVLLFDDSSTVIS